MIASVNDLADDPNYSPPKRSRGRDKKKKKKSKHGFKRHGNSSTSESGDDQSSSALSSSSEDKAEREERRLKQLARQQRVRLAATMRRFDFYALPSDRDSNGHNFMWHFERHLNRRLEGVDTHFINERRGDLQNPYMAEALTKDSRSMSTTAFVKYS